MVVYCSAPGCKNLHDNRFPLQFHSFPLKRPEILEKWIIAVRRGKWHPTKTSKICDAHFTESDYQDRPGTVLKCNAVPSVFPHSPSHLQKKVGCKLLPLISIDQPEEEPPAHQKLNLTRRHCKATNCDNSSLLSPDLQTVEKRKLNRNAVPTTCRIKQEVETTSSAYSSDHESKPIIEEVMLFETYKTEADTSEALDVKPTVLDLDLDNKAAIEELPIEEFDGDFGHNQGCSQSSFNDQKEFCSSFLDLGKLTEL